jgi:hypothetical protein
MVDSVWCVFQRLPGEECPRLAAVCASREAAESQLALSHREQEEMGEAPGEWTVQRWSVLEADVRQVEAADQISHALTGVRDALVEPPAAEPAPGE